MPLTRFTLRQLEAFVSVAEHRSFGRAAERLGLTAQAVSRLVVELERLVGFRLFVRSTRYVGLSYAGRDFLASANTVMRHVRAAERVLGDIRSGASGMVRVGASQVLASTCVPAAIRDFRLVHPEVVIRMYDVVADGVVSAVAAGDVDLAVGPERPVPESVQIQRLFETPWALWCARSHPLAKNRTVRWPQLQDTPLVAVGRDYERVLAQIKAHSPADEKLRISVDVVSNISTMLGIVAQGLAATLAPVYIGTVARPMGLVMRPVIAPQVMRKVCLYLSPESLPSPAALNFAKHLADWMPRWARQERRSGL